MRAGLIAAAAALAALLGGGSTEQTWARATVGGLHYDVKGADVGGGPLVVWSAGAALIACAVLAVLIWRRSAVGRVRTGFGLLAAAQAFSVVGALIGFADVSSAKDEILATVRFDAPGAAVEVTAASGLWTALVVSSLGFVAALWGYLAMRRRDEEG